MRKSAVFLTITLLGIINSASASEWQLVGGQGQMKFVLIPKSKEKDLSVYKDAIKAICKPNMWCGILFWTDQSSVPTKLPMKDSQAKAQTASYIYNPKTSFEEFLWSCRINSNPKECFK